MKRLFVLPLLLLLLPASASAAPLDNCPQIVPISEVENSVGVPGVKGYTVSSGTVPEEFDVQVLGVLQNQVLPGSKVVIARASGAPISDAGGTSAAGMSGSPIYLPGGELLGALAYGYSGSSDIIGITPAAQMTQPAGKIPLGTKTRSRLGITQRGSLSSLPQVLFTSANPLVARPFQKELSLKGVHVASGSTGRSASATPGETLRAGDTAFASLAIGRTSLGGLGTATYVCNDRFSAFGHMLLGDYQVRAIMSQGEIFSYIEDPIWGSYKMGQATNTVGTMTFDGIHGIRGTLGTDTPTVPFRARITDETNQAFFRGTMTEAVQMPSMDTQEYFFSALAGMSLGSEILALTNRGPSAKGSATGGWTIRGSYGGKKFSFARKNAWNGYEGPDGWWSYGTLGDAFAGDMSAILGYASKRNQTIRLRSVDVDIRLRAGEQTLQLQKLSWKKPGGKWKSSAIRGVPRGGKFAVRLHLVRSWGGKTTRELLLRRTRDRGAFAVYPYSFQGPQGQLSFWDTLAYLQNNVQNRLQLRGSGVRLLRGKLGFNRPVEGKATLRVGKRPK